MCGMCTFASRTVICCGTLCRILTLDLVFFVPKIPVLYKNSDSDDETAMQ